ncbi:MAG TPA: ATP-binding protein [Kiritimatiellia bacterium]|nr:ATP-binding protein [Kiritimatiellia bacterium]
MPRKRLLWHLFPFYFFISLVSIGVVLFVARAVEPDTTSVIPLLLFSLLVSLLAAGAMFAIIHRINRTLDNIRDGARRFADGDLSFRLPVTHSQELGQLSDTLNQMAAQLDERIATISHQKNQLDAVLSSMAEGVIALDHHQRVFQINQAASHLLGIPPHRALQSGITEIVRNIDLHRMVDQTLQTGTPATGEIIVYRIDEIWLQVHCTPLRDPATRDTRGVLIVFTDITRLRRLERVRRDFVANVSHELKTPVTSIKGFAETLLDNPDAGPDETRRFYQIINKQTDRIIAVIEDLLSLSRIEQEGEQGELTFEINPLRPILESAIQQCSHHATAKEIPISLHGALDLDLPCNAPLLEQAVINLIDNSIKYSEPRQPIDLHVSSTPTQTRIMVQDRGVGIDPKHLPRIFERFYRVDKARSRRVGGTGLGLSIVKHIATAHGGRVEVTSQVGHGSSFTLILPSATRRDDT